VVHKLTLRSIHGAKPLDRPYEIRDADLKGLLLRVQPSGVKSYVVELRRGVRRTVGSAQVVTLEQARVTARAWLAERDAGKLPEPARGKNKPLTLGEFIANHYAAWVSAERKAGKATLANLDAQFKARFYGTKLAEIGAREVERFKVDRLNAGIAPTTVNRDLARLKAALNKAVEWGYIGASPISAVKKAGGESDGRVRYLNASEEKRLRKALDAREGRRREGRASGNAWRLERDEAPLRAFAEGELTDHLKPIVLLAMNTGLRRGELFSLAWSDVDSGFKRLSVRAANAKSGRTRHVPLNSEARSILEQWRTQSRATGLVFPGPDGARMTNINKSWAALAEDAELQDFRFHDIRHHFASWLVMKGVDLNTVRELLGHSDMSMTLRYAHLAPEHKAEAVSRLSEPLRSPARGTRAKR